MQALREGATKWRMSCSYDEQGRNDADVFEVSISELDPLRSYPGAPCPEVIKVRINGQGCNKCVVGKFKVVYVLRNSSRIL